MKIITKALLSLLLIVSVMSCQKDEQKFNVRYEIETEEPGYVKVEWTTADGGLSGGLLNVINWPNQDNIWSYGYTGTEGLNVLFTGV